MRISDGHLLLSPSDVVAATACTHRAVTAFCVAHGVQAPPPAEPPGAVAKAGHAHEATVTDAFRAAGHEIADLSGRTPDRDAWLLAAEATARHLHGGATTVILQGAVLDDRHHGVTLIGRPDFLVLADDGRWRVEDAKLARSVKATAVLQTMLYRDALAARGVAVHDDVRLHLGDGQHEDVPARTADAWARRQLSDVTALLAALPARGALALGYTASVEWCTACADDSPCGHQRAEDGHLDRVADLRRDQARKLTAAGITTIDALAATPTGTPVPGMRPDTFETLREQAALQVQAESGDLPVHVREHPATVKARDVRPGLWLLPDPDPGDVFFDMEGDPLYSTTAGGTVTNGLEYLFGATHDETGFTPFWAHDRAQEAVAFEQFVDWVEERRATRPGLHVYHYAAYEKSALLRLSSQHATRGEVVDEWLSTGVLVDLYQAVRRGLRVGVASYSLKKIEHLYGVSHAGDGVTSAMGSVEQYEVYRITGEASILDDIEVYNRLDCDSTLQLRDYLLTLRADALAAGTLQPLVVEDAEQPPDESDPSAWALLRAELAEAGERLLDGAQPGTPVEHPVDEARRVLAGLLGYHVREEKAAWQDVHRVAEEVAAGGAAAAVDDGKVLGDLTFASGEITPKGGPVWAFTAPAQEHRVEDGALACVGATPVPVSVKGVETTAEGLRLSVSMSAAKAEAGGWSAELPPRIDGLVPHRGQSHEALQRSLLDLADAVSGPDVAGPDGHRPAGRALLLRRASLAADALPPAQHDEGAVAHAVRLARSATGLVIAVQGPPGSGKSYLGAEVVDTLVADARAAGTSVRIGVSANSHKVVQHLLAVVHRRTPGAVVRHKGGTKKGKNPETWERLCAHEGCGSPVLQTGNKEGWAAGEVIGGTAWAFSPPDSPELDLLIVDEAGQMGLGDVLAASGRARNILLLGDPQQLAKPSQAAHPPGVAVSALEHLMRGQATIPDDVGIFLETSRRMHADVASFISDIAYEGRLASDASCADRAVLPLDGGDADPLSGTGLRYLPTPHAGRTQRSEEECAAVVDVVAALLARSWTRQGVVAPITASDVLVVSPYNEQVRALQTALDAAGLAGVKAGTVDRFQGQEGVAVVYSTASSDADGAPRGLGFLYDTHRLNVAISRAKCLAVWVGSPALLSPRVSTAQQVPLVDAHCRFVERATVLG